MQLHACYESLWSCWRSWLASALCVHRRYWTLLFGRRRCLPRCVVVTGPCCVVLPLFVAAPPCVAETGMVSMFVIARRPRFVVAAGAQPDLICFINSIYLRALGGLLTNYIDLGVYAGV